MKNDDHESRADNDDVSLWIWGASIVFVVFVWAAVTFLIDIGAGEQKFDRGTFGDMFGAVNSLFAGLALATLFYTVFLQRKELAETRQELSEQRKQMEIQSATFKKQQFEDTFFQLLALYGSVVQGIRVDTSMRSGSGVQTKIGRARLGDLEEWLRDGFLFGKRSRPEQTYNDEEVIVDAYEEFYANFETELGHYFRTLYNVVKFVDRSDLSDEGKRFYMNLIRSQLSSQEQVLLFYNCLTPRGAEKFKPLIEKHTLFKSLDPKRLFGPHVHFYATSAFVRPGA